MCAVTSSIRDERRLKDMDLVLSPVMLVMLGLCANRSQIG